MEKASTPANRLTRSATKQVNTTPRKKELEESFDQSDTEEIKHNVRKSRRIAVTKPNTNGDTSTNIDGKKHKSNEEVSDGNSLDDCESEDSNISSKQKSSPKLLINTPSPTISRKSLRTRRSMTPGPDLESSASKKMKRSTSEGKLETLSTPTNRRSGRAKSESKDFVFTPTKTKSNDKEKVSSLSESNSRYMHRNSALRVIDKIIEANEGEECTEDEGKLEGQHQIKSILSKGEIKPLKIIEETEETISMPGDEACDPSSNLCAKAEPNTCSNSEDNINKIKKNDNIEKEICPISITSPSGIKNTEVGLPQEPNMHQLPSFCDLPLSHDSCDLKSKDKTNQCVEDVKSFNNSESIEEPFICENDQSASEAQNLLQDNNKVTNTNTLSEERNVRDGADIDVKPDDSKSQKVVELASVVGSNQVVSNNNSFHLEISEEFTLPIQSEIIAVTENNNVSTTQEQIECEDSPVIAKDIISDFKEIDIPKLVTHPLQSQHGPRHGLNIDDQEHTTPSLNNDTTAINKKDHTLDVNKVICESDSTEPIDESEINMANKENGDCSSVSCHEKPTVVIKKICIETRNKVEKIVDDKDVNIKENHSTLINSEECNVNLEEEALIDDRKSNQSELKENQSPCLDTKIVELESLDIQLGYTHASVDGEDSVTIKFTSPVTSQAIRQDAVEKENVVTVELNQETHKINILDEYGSEECVQNKEDIVIELCNEDTSVLESTVKSDKQSEPLSEENDDEDRTSNKVRGGDSASDSDIYKGMSDFGTDRDEKKDGSHFDDSASSDLRSGTGDSEEYISSVDCEEDEDEEESADQQNVPSNDSKALLDSQRNSQETNSKIGELFDTNTPMTYDKALAILNKNRVNKIDDEEFFDMFTQELNRVSEESGSDSDIAIVDEYIIEPEETAKMPNENSGSLQANSKPAKKTSPLPIHLTSSTDHFAGDYNQHVPPQHSHPSMPRMNFSQGGLYHEYNQGISHANVIRSPVMCDVFVAPTNSGSVTLNPSQMFSNQVPPDVNFTRAAMFKNPLGPVSDAQLHYRNASALKVRNINAMNGLQSSNNINTDYAGPEEEHTARNPKNESSINENVRKAAGTMTETDDKLKQSLSHDSARNTLGNATTSTLELLGLDKEKLNILKLVLGMYHQKSKKKSPKAISKRNVIEHLSKIQKGVSKSIPLEKVKLNSKKDKPRKKRHRARKVKNTEKGFKSPVTLQSTCTFDGFEGSAYSTSTEHSDEIATSSSETFPSTSQKNLGFQESSSEASKQSGNREVKFEDGNMSVKINARENKFRYRDWKRCRTAYKNSSYNIAGTDSLRMKKKRNQADKTFKESSSSGSLDTEIGSSRKMTQEKKQKRIKPCLLKSNCGTFSVESLPATSQSSESEEERSQINQTSASSSYINKTKGSMERNLASGKNKLSNKFIQHSIQHEQRGSKRKLNKTFTEIEKQGNKQKARKLNKLQADILEQLSKGSKMIKGPQVTDSDSEKVFIEQPGKKRKRSKLKVKSIISEKDFIPFVTAGGTQFTLSRIDKDVTLDAARKAAKFRSDHLYGATVKRITTKELLNIKKKQKTVAASSKKSTLNKEPK